MSYDGAEVCSSPEVKIWRERMRAASQAVCGSRASTFRMPAVSASSGRTHIRTRTDALCLISVYTPTGEYQLFGL